MAAYPLHGMLAQETEAGAVAPSVTVGDINLATTEGGDGTSVSSVTATGKDGVENAIFSYQEMKIIEYDMFYRSVLFGYIDNTGKYLAPYDYSFTCDTNMYISGTPHIETVADISPQGLALYDGQWGLSVYEGGNQPKVFGAHYWNAAKDIFQIEVGFGSGGVQRDLAFCANNGAAKWKIAFASGAHFLATTDNTQNIGAAGANRPAKIFLAPSTATHSHLNLAAGVAPTTPADGDIWFEATGLKVRIGGVTKTVTVA